MSDDAKRGGVGRVVLFFFLAALASGLFFNYGGIRSPDTEIVYLTAESLAHRGTFALEHGCTLTNRGIARGVDGKLYSWFGQAQSIAWVPFVWLADGIGRITDLSKLGQIAPPNHNFSNGFEQFWFNHPKQDPAGDARRFIASPLNAILFAITVPVFFLLVRKLTGHFHAACLAAVIFGWCTLEFQYATDTFSEVMTTIFVVLSLCALVPEASASRRDSPPFLGGLWIGLAVATHITAGLFVPFFALLTQMPRRSFRPLVAFGIGGSIPLALLAWHNWARFGVPWETGRSVVKEVLERAQGTVSPWRGLGGLFFGASNGLLIYCPVVLLGIVGWRSWKKSVPVWAWVLLAAFVFRLLFIATRRDWHGGVGAGPRYFVMMLPLFILPVAYWLRDQLQAGNRRNIMLAGALAAVGCAEQLYLCIGETGSYLQAMRISYVSKGLNGFLDDRIYLDWSSSPLLGLHRGLRGPWLLREVPLTNIELWLFFAIPAAALILFIFHRVSSASAKNAGST